MVKRLINQSKKDTDGKEQRIDITNCVCVYFSTILNTQCVKGGIADD